MNSKIISTLPTKHPFEIVTVEVTPFSNEEEKIAKEHIAYIYDYLTLKLQAIEVIAGNYPQFIIKKVRDSIGFGK
jgi:hypothetical protein